MVILSDNLLIDAFDGVRGGTDHAVVKRQPQAVQGGQVKRKKITLQIALQGYCIYKN